MSKAEKDASRAARRIEELREEIRRHDQLYFVENRPELSDEQYDALVRELRALEQRCPRLVTPDSPTQRVGERPLEGFEHVEHAVPMLSIDNTYSQGDLREFDRRIARRLEGRAYDYVADPKIDGVAVTLRYESGRLALGATRGDGRTGDVITENLRTLRSIPLKLRPAADMRRSRGRVAGWPDVLEARGEVFWPLSSFRRENERRLGQGDEPFKNPRNATAGTLKQLDPRLVAGRGLLFQCHGYGRIEPFPRGVSLHTELFDRFREWGLPTSPHARRCPTIDAVHEFVVEWEWKRHQMDYETDGLVIKVNQLALRDTLGSTAKAPRWCIAYKYAAEQAQTRLRRVDFQVGRTGTITPRATFEPVQLSGTTVTHATLHNFDQVRRLELHEGDRITVEKAGEIIPQVVAVDVSARKKGAKPIRPPAECPECRGPVMQDEGGVYLRCINPACPAQLVERIIYFCGRSQMDIEAAGEVVVEKLIEHGLVRSYADLYRLAAGRDALASLPVSVNSRTGSPITLGSKRADKLLEGIEASKARPLSRVLAALNIRHVGATTAELLAEHFGSMEKLASASDGDLLEVEGVGPELAGSLRAFFVTGAGKRTIDELASVGVNMTQPRRAAKADSPIAGKTLVVTGTLGRFTRREAEDLIKRHGGKAIGSVSGNTDYLVAGADPGSKLDKARKLGVNILDEEAFVKLLGI